MINHCLLRTLVGKIAGKEALKSIIYRSWESVKVECMKIGTHGLYKSLKNHKYLNEKRTGLRINNRHMIYIQKFKISHTYQTDHRNITFI